MPTISGTMQPPCVEWLLSDFYKEQDESGLPIFENAEKSVFVGRSHEEIQRDAEWSRLNKQLLSATTNIRDNEQAIQFLEKWLLRSSDPASHISDAALGECITGNDVPIKDVQGCVAEERESPARATTPLNPFNPLLTFIRIWDDNSHTLYTESLGFRCGNWKKCQPANDFIELKNKELLNLQRISNHCGHIGGPSDWISTNFGPVSPRVIIVLRSNTLPEALEDKDSKVENARQRMLYTASAQFPEPENVKSILEDLPVAKAMNSYSRVVNSKLELAPGESGTPQCRDSFIFRFWPISTSHMNIINSIFLDNLLRCNSIVFGSRIPFRQTLEAYMNTQAHGFKKIGVGEYGAKTTRLACLENLVIVLKKLGVEKVPIFCDETGEGKKPFIRSLDDE